MAAADELAALRAENARLTGLLDAHGIPWRQRLEPPDAVASPAAVCTKDAAGQPATRLNPADKVALFGRLFRGRTDVFPVRWESKTSG